MCCNVNMCHVFAMAGAYVMKSLPILFMSYILAPSLTGDYAVIKYVLKVLHFVL